MSWEALKSWADSIRWIGMRCEDGGLYADMDMVNYFVDNVYEVVKGDRIYRYEGDVLTLRKG